MEKTRLRIRYEMANVLGVEKTKASVLNEAGTVIHSEFLDGPLTMSVVEQIMKNVQSINEGARNG